MAFHAAYAGLAYALSHPKATKFDSLPWFPRLYAAILLH